MGKSLVSKINVYICRMWDASRPDSKLNMKSTDSEPQGGGMELEQYRTSLEQMVEEKSKDLIAIQENLEATNRRQALFIKVLQIL